MITRITLTTLVAFGLLCHASLRADDAELSPQDLEAQIMALGVPGEEHELFQPMVGNWTTENLMFVPGADEPIASEGAAEFKLILDGRFLVQQFEGEFAGMPFNGYGLSGYDRAQEKYVGFWTDSFSTGLMTIEGSYDEETKEMTEFGTFPIPGGEMRTKTVTRWLNDDQFHFTMYMLEGDSETKNLEITYTRDAE